MMAGDCLYEMKSLPGTDLAAMTVSISGTLRTANLEPIHPEFPCDVDVSAFVLPALMSIYMHECTDHDTRCSREGPR